MRLDELSVFQYRNLTNQTIRFNSPVSVLVGRNGHGKTSILEAIYLFAHTRSFRAASIRDLIQWNIEKGNAEHSDNHRTASIEGVFSTSVGRKTVRCELIDGSRKVFVNDKRIESAEMFYGAVRVIEFTPDDLFLVKGEPSQRRQFLDKILALIDPRYVEHLVRYQRALKSRNAILQTTRSSHVPDELSAYHELLIEHGRFLAERRGELITELGPMVSELYAQIARTENERATLALRSHFSAETELLSSDDLRKEYVRRLSDDQHQQRTSFGIHRDDLVLRLDTGHGARAARNAASQGQTRSFALALKMAAVRFVSAHTGEDPILLLDDVESELDATRREALNALILDYKSQIIVTTTDATKLPFDLDQNADFFEIQRGLVRILSTPL